MLRRMALWFAVGVVSLFTTVAIGQPGRDAATLSTSARDAGAASATGTLGGGATTTGAVRSTAGDAGVTSFGTSATLGRDAGAAALATRDAGAAALATRDAGAAPLGTGDAGLTTTGAYVPTPPGGTSSGNSAAQAQVDAATYAVRLRDLEQRINELKEQIFRSKARLSLLAETVLQGVVAGAQTVIVHENQMSGSYKLVKAVYALDGAPIFNRADEEGGLSERNEFDVYNGAIVPGEHTLTVNLEYRGHGYGIFSYLKGYRFKVRSSYSFSAPEGKAVNLRVVAYEKGGPTAPLEERPAIRYQERVSEPAAPQQVAEATGAQGAQEGR